MITTFQAVVYSIIHGMSEFLPISSKAHEILIPYLIGWPEAHSELLGAMSLGSFLALFFYFRHDWASMISCFLQVILFRKRPMTLDERLPLFLLLSSLPMGIAYYYFYDRVHEINWTPPFVAIVFASMSLPLWFFDSMNRKIKNLVDWNGFDAFIVGITQASAIVPGWDPMSGVLVGAFFLNYRREPATKYAYYALAPLMFVKTILHFQTIHIIGFPPMEQLSWLSFGVSVVVTFFVSLLAIGGFLKHVVSHGLGQYFLYRIILAAGVGMIYFLRG